MGVNPDARSNKAHVAEEAARCFELRLSGMTIRGIAHEMGFSPSTAEKRIKQALTAVVVPGVEEMRKTEGERLLHLLSKLQPQVDAGDQGAIKLAAQLSASYRKLFGLDAPQEHTLQVHQVTQNDLELQEMIREARARAQLDKEHTQ